MHPLPRAGLLVGAATLCIGSIVAACGNSTPPGYTDAGSNPAQDGGAEWDVTWGDTGPIDPFDGSQRSSEAGVGEGGVACPTGLACNVVCTDGGTTTITGKVYD